VWFGTNSRLGITILTSSPFQLIHEGVRPGSASMFAARVQGPISFTLIAVWAQAEPSYSEVLRRGLVVYRDLLLDGPTVLLGDLNSSAAWDAQRGRRDHLELEAQLRQEYGLVSAYHAATGEASGSESQPTHYWRWREQAPFHLDYCYLPEAWLPGLESVTVGTYQDWANVSDHRPVIIDVDPAKVGAVSNLK
jgi:endonuclease/exonuclease/phosphatase family metal-dependent hydrolase